MSQIAERTSSPTIGLRQLRAAQLRSELEAPGNAGQVVTPNQENDFEHGDADPLAAGPVGQGDYVVKQGDCISSIAKSTGHFWETIWNHPANAELKEARQDPNVLLPDDRVTIPPLGRKEEPGQTEMRHRFVRHGEPTRLRLRITDEEVPQANQPYVLEVGDRQYQGFTDAEGKLEQLVPASAGRGLLEVGQDDDARFYTLALGELDPVGATAGVQQRLNSLGFDSGPVDGKVGPLTREALRRFQGRHELEATGRPDEPTQRKLEDMHGS